MNKNDDIVIFENPQKGMASHPLLGIGLLRNIDISTNPGSARLIKTMTKVSGSTVTALPQWIVKSPASSSTFFALDSAGQVYTSTNSGSSWSTVAGETSGGSGQGMAIWKGYLFVARATALDVYGPLASSPSWTNSWKTDLDATADFHTMFTSIDDNLYIACGRYVYKIAEATGPFAPGTGSTYTATARAITLAANYNIKCIHELGSNLILGTWFGSTAALYDKVADIFPYNRSTLTLGVPVHLEENGIHAMTVVGNRLYVVAGATAKLFITDGSSASLVATIPQYAVNIIDSGGYFNVYPDAIMYHRGKIYVGLGSPSTPSAGNCGIWSYDISSPNSQLVLENTVSTTVTTGNDGSIAELEIGTLFSMGSEAYLAGWKDFSGTPSSGIDLRSSSSFTTSYSGRIETAVIHVGTALSNRSVQSVEFYLLKPLLSGQGVKVYYRKDLYNTWTLLSTVDYTTSPSKQSCSISAAKITNAIFLQFKFELTSGGSDTPELVKAILKPSN